jgi:hypothetical protein
MQVIAVVELYQFLGYICKGLINWSGMWNHNTFFFILSDSPHSKSELHSM